MRGEDGDLPEPLRPLMTFMYLKGRKKNAIKRNELRSLVCVTSNNLCVRVSSSRNMPAILVAFLTHTYDEELLESGCPR